MTTQTPDSKPRALIAMSGGVDSAVSYQFLFDVEAAQTQLDSLLSAD